MTMTYLWQQKEFYEDLQQVCNGQAVQSIQSHAARLDLHPHYDREHLTSGIVPSPFNFGRVTGIWMRYGKHKDELQLFGKSYKQSKAQKAPIEQFHKHACLQLAIGEHGLSMGMFHSTANDGVDCGHVKDHWPDVQQKIRAVYGQVQGHQFVWTFHSNRENRHIADFDLDNHTAEQFVTFYKRYYLEGYESFCMRFFETDNTRIKTYKDVVRELCATFDAIMPLYEAMAFRVPVGMRG